jgi:hypothetical protein
MESNRRRCQAWSVGSDILTCFNLIMSNADAILCFFFLRSIDLLSIDIIFMLETTLKLTFNLNTSIYGS